MKKVNYFIILACLAVSVAACKTKSETDSARGEAAEPKAAAEGMITGEEMMGDYVTLVCKKYLDCGIQAFADRSDCENRIRAILTQDSQWKQLELNRAGLDTCLADFKALSCEDFQSGKAPESCAVL